MIPIYRAKKIDSDEWIEGYLVSNARKRFYYIYGDSNGYEFKEPIDPSTLAIHFPNSSNTLSKEKRWYNMDEISNIIKEHEDGNMATD